MSEQRRHPHTKSAARRGGKHLAGRQAELREPAAEETAVRTAVKPLIPEWEEAPAETAHGPRRSVRDAVRTWQDTEGEISPAVTAWQTLR